MSCRPASRRSSVVAIACFATVLLAACTSDQPANNRPEVIRFGVLPDDRPDVLEARFSPLLAYLQGQLETSFELVIPSDYQDLVDQFAAGNLELAFFGGLTYAQAAANSNAEPIVMRDIDARFTSVFLVPADSDAETLLDLEGSRFAFGSRLSTSGHLMPRHFLAQQAIVPEEFFADVRYSGRHDTTALWVRDGQVDGGALNATIFRSMMSDGRLTVNNVRPLWETPPYVDYVIAAHPDLGDDVRQRIVAACLALSVTVNEHADVLDPIGAAGFLPAA